MHAHTDFLLVGVILGAWLSSTEDHVLLHGMHANEELFDGVSVVVSCQLFKQNLVPVPSMHAETSLLQDIAIKVPCNFQRGHCSVS